MDVIEKIIAGHREVSEKRDILAKLLKSCDNDAFFWDRAEELEGFFKKEVREHFEIEEKVLFPVLKKVLGQEHFALIMNLEREHAPILRLLDDFRIISENHRRFASKATREQMIKAGFEIIKLISEHAGKEDRELFSFVKEKLSNENYMELESLYFKYLKI